MNFAALNTQSPLLIAKKAITSSLEAGTCVQSPSMLLLALKGINQRVKQSSQPELSQDAGICLHPSAQGWKCSLEAMQVVRPCPAPHQFPGLPLPWQLLLLLPHRKGNYSRDCALIPAWQGEFVSVQGQCCRGTSPSPVPSKS